MNGLRSFDDVEYLDEVPFGKKKTTFLVVIDESWTQASDRLGKIEMLKSGQSIAVVWTGAWSSDVFELSGAALDEARRQLMEE